MVVMVPRQYFQLMNCTADFDFICTQCLKKATASCIVVILFHVGYCVTLWGGRKNGLEMPRPLSEQGIFQHT